MEREYLLSILEFWGVRKTLVAWSDSGTQITIAGEDPMHPRVRIAVSTVGDTFDISLQTVSTKIALDNQPKSTTHSKEAAAVFSLDIVKGDVHAALMEDCAARMIGYIELGILPNGNEKNEEGEKREEGENEGEAEGEDEAEGTRKRERADSSDPNVPVDLTEIA